MIKQDEYEVNNGEDSPLNLTNKVVLYTDGDLWKIVPLSIMKKYPILYDCFHESGEGIYPITLVVCPISLITIVLKGLYTFEKYNDVIILRSDSITFPINNIPKNIKRLEAKILTLKNAITLVRDISYIILKKQPTKKTEKLKSYYKDNPYDKSLVYVISYKSFKTKNDKYSIIIGKNINKDTITGYDISKSGVLEYLTKNQQKIINKEGYSFPCLLYMAFKLFPNSRIVYLI